MLYAVVGFVSLVVLVACVVDIVRTPGDQVRTLPKLLWIALVVLLPLPAGAGWLLLGRPAPGQGSAPAGQGGPVRLRPGGAAPRRAPAGPPDDDEEFLRSLRARVEEQRRRAEQERREAGEQP